MHFLRAGVDKRFDAYKTPHPAATGQGGVMCCTRDPKVGTLVFFASCLNIREILQNNNADNTEKERSSSHNANLIAPYASEKIAYGVQITRTVCTVYGNPKYKR